jgi:hypothetical protein
MKLVFAALFMALSFSIACAARIDQGAFLRCDSLRAQLVEERLSTVTSWREFAVLYRAYRSCDASALSYGFTEAIASLAADAGNISELQKEIGRDPRLKTVVLRHLRSESVSAEQVEKITKAMQAGCPPHSRRLCAQLLRAVNSGRE